VYFQGGGSCWDEHTTISSLNESQTYCATDALPWLPHGMFDLKDVRNSYANYTIINILYCSGDNHIGSVTRDYTDHVGGVVKQAGAANVNAVLQWLEAQQEQGGLAKDLTDLVVTGCSAGSLAAQVWGNEIIRRLGRPLRSALLLDSYAGFFPSNTEAELMFEFGACDLYFLSDNVRQLCLAKEATLSVFVSEALISEPRVPYMFLQSRYDVTQMNYYNYIVNSAQFEGLYSEIDEFEFAEGVDNIFTGYSVNTNFLVYFVDNYQHCYTPLPYMYTANSAGNSLSTAASTATTAPAITAATTAAAITAATISGVATPATTVKDMAFAYDASYFDFTTETMMKWVFRAPLLPGEVISSVCGENDVCLSTAMNHVYQQSDQETEVSYSGSSSKIVAQLKALPRYDSSMTKVKTDFNISNGEVDWRAYGSSIVPLPALIYSIGVFAVLLLIVITLFVTMVKAVVYTLTRSDEKNSNDDMTTEARKAKVLRRAFRYVNLTNTMYSLLAIAFLSNVVIIIGNVKVSSGIRTTLTTLDDLDTTFTVLIQEADDLAALGMSTRNWLELAEEACPDYDGLVDSLDYYDQSVSDFNEGVTYVPDELGHYYEYVNEWGVDNRNIFVWTLFCVLNAVVLMYALSVRYSNKGLLKCSIFFSVLIIVLSFSFAAIYMISLVITTPYSFAYIILLLTNYAIYSILYISTYK
jgi:hypothetical protein